MLRLLVIFFLASLSGLRGADAQNLASPEHRLQPNDPAWRDLLAQVEHRPDGVADFEERRYFAFKSQPTVLKGEARVSSAHGLSLRYSAPPEHLVIIDSHGILLREGGRDTTPPSDPRATAANTALLHLLQFDLGSLATDFETYGERSDDTWTIALIPRDDSIRRSLGQITVSGEKATVRRIEMRRSLTQRVEILIAPPQTAVPFTAEELRRFFR